MSTSLSLTSQNQLLKPGGSMLTRGLALLDAYRIGEVELSQAELARRTNLPKPTVHRLVAELVEWQALERTKTGVRLGPRLYLLGQRVPRIRLVRSASQPHLDRLHEVTGHYACLSMLDCGGVFDVAWAGLAPWRHLPHAAPMAAMSAAALKALLANDAEQESSVVHGIVERQFRPVSEPSQKLLRLASVAVAVSVAGGVVGAVSVVGLADGLDVRGIGTQVRATATAVGRQLALSQVFSR
jgi:DNA-binding IclR family transcriptional regulator